MRIYSLDSTPSTSRVAAELGPEAEHGLVVTTPCQTAGRGQRGNSWEAEPGKNLTFSVVLRPDWPALRQFELSMLTAVVVAQCTEQLIEMPVRVKWPNDIYVGDRKICGILFENSLAGTKLDRAIIGIGLNLNQRQFRSDAPNPVSAVQLTGVEYDLEQSLHTLAAALIDAVDAYVQNPDVEQLSTSYHARLYRNDGNMHLWRDCASGSEFAATIVNVEPTGFLNLVDSDGNAHRYAFKEVQWGEK